MTHTQVPVHRCNKQAYEDARQKKTLRRMDLILLSAGLVFGGGNTKVRKEMINKPKSKTPKKLECKKGKPGKNKRRKQKRYSE